MPVVERFNGDSFHVRKILKMPLAKLLGSGLEIFQSLFVVVVVVVVVVHKSRIKTCKHIKHVKYRKIPIRLFYWAYFGERLVIGGNFAFQNGFSPGNKNSLKN